MRALSPRLLTGLFVATMAITTAACRDGEGFDAANLRALAAAQAAGTSASTAANQDPGGIYTGIVHSTLQSTNHMAFAFVDSTGAMQLMDEETSGQYVAALAVRGTNASGSLRVYNPTGPLAATGTFTGTVTSRTAINGTFSTSDGDQGTLALTYDSADTQPVALASLAGNYQYQSPRGSTLATASVQADGRVSGTNEYGCAYTGTISAIDPRYNLFHITETITGAGSGNCTGAVSGTVTGLAGYFPDTANSVSVGTGTLDIFYNDSGFADVATFQPAS